MKYSVCRLHQFWYGLLLYALVAFTAAPVWAVELPILIQHQVEADPRILSARALHQSKLVEAEGALSVYRPTLRGTGSLGNVGNQDPLQRQGRKRSVGLELEQPIPVFGREAARVALARVAVQVEAAEVTRVEQAVVGEVLETMLGLGAAQDALALRERVAANLREQLVAVQATVAGGGMKVTEERMVQSRAAQQAALRARTAADVAAATARLARLLPGAAAVQRLQAQELRAWWRGAVTQQAMEQGAMQSAPTLRKAQAEAEMAGAEYALARSDLWPKLSLTMNKQVGRFGDASAGSHAIFLGVTAPLYDGGATTSRVDSAVFKHAAAKDKAEYERRMTGQRVAEAWVRWQGAQAIALAWQESVQQEAEAVGLTQEQLAAGAATQLVLLRAQQTWLEAMLQSADYAQQRDLAWVRLLQEAGALGLTHPAP